MGLNQKHIKVNRQVNKAVVNKVNEQTNQNLEKIEMLKKKLKDDIQDIHNQNRQLIADAKERTRHCSLSGCNEIHGCYNVNWNDQLELIEILDCEKCKRPMCRSHGVKCYGICIICEPNHWTWE